MRKLLQSFIVSILFVFVLSENEETHWCYEDTLNAGLGSEQGTDRCCKEHHNCGPSLKPHQSLVKELDWLSNNSSETIYTCECELTFNKCLADDQSKSSKYSLKHRKEYFEATYRQCFKKMFEPMKCLQNVTVKKYFLGVIPHNSHELCTKYQLNTKGPKKYHLIDLYVGLPPIADK